MSRLSAFGVDLTPPNPVHYATPANPGNIKNVLSSVNDAQNQANVANNDRYKQLLQLLNQGATGQQQSYDTARGVLGSNYGSALGSLSNSLGNNQTVFNNDQLRATQDAVKASSSAQQNGISRGLGNTTIMNSMQDQVSRAKNDAMANIAAKKAEADNSVYNNIANIYQNQGNAASGLQERQGNAYATGADTLGNAVASRNDIGPSIGDYAGVISGAAQAQNSSGRTTTTTTNPIPINSPIYQGGGLGGSGGGGGGIQASMGQGGFNQSASGGVTQTSPAGGQVYYGPNAANNPNNTGGSSAPIASAMAPQTQAPATPGSGFITGGGTTTAVDQSGNISQGPSGGPTESYQSYVARMQSLSLSPKSEADWRASFQ